MEKKMNIKEKLFYDKLKAFIKEDLVDNKYKFRFKMTRRMLNDEEKYFSVVLCIKRNNLVIKDPLYMKKMYDNYRSIFGVRTGFYNTIDRSKLAKFLKKGRMVKGSFIKSDEWTFTYVCKNDTATLENIIKKIYNELINKPKIKKNIEVLEEENLLYEGSD